jgi:hypothetical protein
MRTGRNAMRSAGIDARNGALGKRSSHRVDLLSPRILPTRARFSKAIVRPIVRPQLVRGSQNVRPACVPAGCPSGFARQDCRSITEGCFPAIQAAWSRPGNPLDCQLSQARQRVSLGVLEGAGKTEGSSGYAWATRGTPYMCRCARQRFVAVYVFGIGNGHLSGCLMVSADR